jgi:hypothetical protein
LPPLLTVGGCGKIKGPAQLPDIVIWRPFRQGIDQC